MASILKPAPRWLSVLLVVAYSAVFSAGVRVAFASGVHAGTPPLRLALHALCTVYAVELLLSLQNLCAMAGGWTFRELLFHHGLYIAGVQVLIINDDRWAPALAVSLLTAANEAALIAEALGAPPAIAALRRLYGFSIVSVLAATEVRCYVAVATAAPRLVATHAPLLAIGFHLDLLRMYVRRWARTRHI